jgi:hypothetical protein
MKITATGLSDQAKGLDCCGGAYQRIRLSFEILQSQSTWNWQHQGCTEIAILPLDSEMDTSPRGRPRHGVWEPPRARGPQSRYQLPEAAKVRL